MVLVISYVVYNEDMNDKDYDDNNNNNATTTTNHTPPHNNNDDINKNKNSE